MTRKTSLTYLATPYSLYVGGLEQAFEEAATLAGMLIASGMNIYSPIVHCHSIAIHGRLDPLDHSLWLALDDVMLAKCDVLLVAHMAGWENSFGIKHEIAFFQDAKKPIFDLDPETMIIKRRQALVTVEL